MKYVYIYLSTSTSDLNDSKPDYHSHTYEKPNTFWFYLNWTQFFVASNGVYGKSIWLFFSFLSCVATNQGYGI